MGTVSNSGLYTPPSSPGAHTVKATSSTNSAYSVTAAVAVTDLTGVTTWHNDVARTVRICKRYALTPTTVSSGYFGKRWSCPLDGTVYAQPLYVANLSIGGGTHNVLFVATMNDTDLRLRLPSVTYWTRSFVQSEAPAAASRPSRSAAATCGDNLGGYGITGTPVIDPSAQTIYLVAATTDNGTNFQRLHALNLATGAEQTSPAVIAAQVPGTRAAAAPPPSPSIRSTRTSA